MSFVIVFQGRGQRVKIVEATEVTVREYSDGIIDVAYKDIHESGPRVISTVGIGGDSPYFLARIGACINDKDAIIVIDEMPENETA